MVVKFATWGNSFALRVPRAFIEELGVAEGACADMSVQNGRLVITPSNKTPHYDLSELISGMTEENMHAEVRTGSAIGGEFS